MKKQAWLAGFILLCGCASLIPHRTHTGPWNLPDLEQTPAATWGQSTGLVQEVYYEGEPLNGKPTRVFAYCARPPQNAGPGPFPAMLLVHGGGGKAFSAWAEHWAKRGYVALAMDTAGHGPTGPLPDGGPGQSDQSKFKNFSPEETDQMWTYHAVAAVIRGHSLLASLEEVDPNRIGITGISWGGYLTCIVAGLDKRLRVAVPVYGCGFLDENSVWKDGPLAAMTPEQRNLWVECFDPSSYLPGVHSPILFLNGSNDFAYPLDSYQKSYNLVRDRLRTVSVIIRLKHGHYWEFKEVDYFVDSVLSGGQPLARLSPMTRSGREVRAGYSTSVRLLKAELHYTADTGPWQQRNWKTVSAEFDNREVKGTLPSERPLVCYLSVSDQRHLSVSTPHLELSDRDVAQRAKAGGR